LAVGLLHATPFKFQIALNLEVFAYEFVKHGQRRGRISDLPLK